MDAIRAKCFSICALVLMAGCARDETLGIRSSSPTPEATSVQSSAESKSPVDPTLLVPASSLFETAWGDRDPFRAGLIGAEQYVLEELPGATVYHMQIEMDDTLTKLEGQLELLYTNNEDVALSELYFHLFPNLLGGRMNIGEARVNGGAVEPGYLSGRSVMRITLPQTLMPGQPAALRIVFTTEIPTERDSNRGIFAHFESILALAHFYPMVAVYDEQGWNIGLPSPNGDPVYADSSFYLVNVTAPSEQVLVATGVEVSRRETSETQTVSFAAGPARDFFLASSDRYTLHSAMAGETRVNSYAPEELSEGSRAAVEHAAAALQRFGGRFGTYPYTELDIVATPNLVLGVEYPGIFALTTRIYETNGASGGGSSRNLIESTTVHETAHQWFYGVIGNDQLDEPWLDESLAQYSTWLYYADQYGQNAAQALTDSFARSWGLIGRAEIPIGLPVEAYQDSEYVPIIYGRGPIFLGELGQVIGQDRLDLLLKEYYQTNQWGIATTAIFMRLAENQCSCDLADLFQAWVVAK